MNFSGKNVVVTGGSSFIGSHLVDLLLQLGASVTVIDDLSSGKVSNLKLVINDINFVEGNVKDQGLLDRHFPGKDTVFHLAAIHGGRGFIEKYPEKMMENLSLDFGVFQKCLQHGVGRVVHASSACAYPINLQDSSSQLNFLNEDMANFDEPTGSFPDGAYGWTKLMGEYQLLNISTNTTTGRSARIFTAYGSRENESHAMVALVAKALLKMSPYPIWGDGQQTRNFTHVADTVMGLAHLALDRSEKKFDVFNIGTSEHHSVKSVVQEIFNQINWTPPDFEFQLDRPTGVRSRASDNTKISKTFGWEPSVSIQDGISELLDWYSGERLPSMDRDTLVALLDSR
jgi:UDP-glucose 4-epimerase